MGPPPGQQGLMVPPPNMQPSFMTSSGPFGQFAAPPPPVGHRKVQSSVTGGSPFGSFSGPMGGIGQSGGQGQGGGGSSGGGHGPGQGPGQGPGHARRHSLALADAKKAAALVQAKRQGNSGAATATAASASGSGSGSGRSSGGNPSSSPPGLSPSKNSMPPPSFKFPSSPEKTASAASGGDGSGSSGYRGHSRSQSMQNNGGSNSSRGFQFPAKMTGPESQSGASGSSEYSGERRGSIGGGGHQHQRSGSRNFDTNWRNNQASGGYGDVNAAAGGAGGGVSMAGGMLAPPTNQFIPSHRPRGSYNSSISSLNAYSMYPNQGPGGGQVQGAGGQARKSLFAPYLPQASLPGLLEEGRLVAGILRVNRKNRSDAYVSTDGLLDADIFICGSKDRNRALEGDLVAVELLEVDEVWGSKKEKEEKKKRRDASMFSDVTTGSGDIDDNINDNGIGGADGAGNGGGFGGSGGSGGSGGATGLRRKGSLKQRPTQKKNDDVEVEGQSLLLAEEEELTDEIKPLYAGHVVAVIERIPGQMFSGTLGLLRPSSQATKDKQAEKKDHHRSNTNSNEAEFNKPKIVWFKPTDKRVPLIAIPTEQAPKDFVERHEHYANRTFVASIKRWPITSLHPFGTLVEELGQSDSTDIQLEAILRDNNFSSQKFSESVQKVIPTVEEQQQTEAKQEAAGAIKNVFPSHRDFSSEFVMAFSSNDLLTDEAIHIKKVSDDRITLGIHISDVTHYCKENSPLDREAKKRGSAVFLKQRDIHLFPPEFLEIASFAVGKTSPTISVIFEIDTSTFDVVDTVICQGLINPKQKISYNVVEDIISNNDESAVSQGVANYIKTLQLLSLRFRKQRLDEPASSGIKEVPILGLLNFLEEDSVKVTASLFDGKQSHQLFDEINIKVNTAIAQKLYAVLSSRAFLRRHSEPILSKLESFATLVRSLGIDIDTSSSAGLQKSLFKIESDEVRKALETLLYKCMNKAKYFVAAKVDDVYSHGHYWLNVPLYTHFNAPLRRYADLIVHRQIKSVISGTEYNEDISALATSADYCNFKKDSAKNAQEQSIHLFLCQVIEGLSASTGQLIRDSIVIQVYESAFDVLIPEFGIEKRVHGDQLPLVKAEFHKSTRLLELFWEKGVDSAKFIPEDERNLPASQLSTKYHASTADSATAQAAAAQEQTETITKAISKLAVEAAAASSSSTSTSAVSSSSGPAATSQPSSGHEILGTASDDVSKSLPSSPRPGDSHDKGPQRTSSLSEMHSTTASAGEHNRALDAYLEGVTTRIEGDNHIQEIRVMQHVPVLIRAEVGKGLPCITVRAINPFLKD
ncbi:mRNA-binding translational repressor SSD1 [Sugiyamaella lignohabitans]|uniref:mRNA-binding translational repressor SSD1 n=1 Tax=Sugiyamaella lignohabitans TaxID=796027 RepID=A0A167EJ91_9ASCO|nr:mRNA-binding translational repressor SSD1 [Sugiyamaella lignohabitans]ANB14145.1 mRNA-binding translational repressor SSD1 [Sugiyamaella lignohabitans]